MRCHGYAEECVKTADLPLNKQLGHVPHAHCYAVSTTCQEVTLGNENEVTSTLSVGL